MCVSIPSWAALTHCTGTCINQNSWEYEQKVIDGNYLPVSSGMQILEIFQYKGII